jgi:hypothetical protein
VNRDRVFEQQLSKRIMNQDKQCVFSLCVQTRPYLSIHMYPSSAWICVLTQLNPQNEAALEKTAKKNTAKLNNNLYRTAELSSLHE